MHIVCRLRSVSSAWPHLSLDLQLLLSLLDDRLEPRLWMLRDLAVTEELADAQGVVALSGLQHCY